MIISKPTPRKPPLVLICKHCRKPLHKNNLGKICKKCAK